MSNQKAITKFNELIRELEEIISDHINKPPQQILDYNSDDYFDKCLVLIRNFYPVDGVLEMISPYEVRLKEIMFQTRLHPEPVRIERLRNFIKNNMLIDLSLREEDAIEIENDAKNVQIEYHKDVTKKQNALIENLNGIIKDQQHKIDVLSKVKSELESLKNNANELTEKHASEMQTLKDHHAKFEAGVQVLIKSALKERVYNSILLFLVFTLGNILIQFLFKEFNWLAFATLEAGLILCFIIFHNKKSREVINSSVGIFSLAATIIYSSYTSAETNKKEVNKDIDTTAQTKYDSIANFKVK